MSVKTTQVEQVHPLLWQTVWVIYYPGLLLQTTCLRKSLNGNKVSPLIPLIRRQVVWRSYFEQITEKQLVITFAPNPQKRKDLPYMEIVVASTKGKGCPKKECMNRLKSYKSSNLLLWEFVLWKSFSTTAPRFFRLPMYPTTGEVSHQHLLKIRIQCSVLSELNNFSLQEVTCN